MEHIKLILEADEYSVMEMKEELLEFHDFDELTQMQVENCQSVAELKALLTAKNQKQAYLIGEALACRYCEEQGLITPEERQKEGEKYGIFVEYLSALNSGDTVIAESYYDRLKEANRVIMESAMLSPEEEQIQQMAARGGARPTAIQVLAAIAEGMTDEEIIREVKVFSEVEKKGEKFTYEDVKQLRLDPVVIRTLQPLVEQMTKNQQTTE